MFRRCETLSRRSKNDSCRERMLMRGSLLSLLTVEEALRREYPHSVGDIGDGYADDLRRVILDLREVILHACYNER